MGPEQYAAETSRFTVVGARSWFHSAFMERDLMLEWDVESLVDQILQIHPLFTARRMDIILSLLRKYAEMSIYEFYANVSSRTSAQFDA